MLVRAFVLRSVVTLIQPLASPVRWRLWGGWPQTWTVACILVAALVVAGCGRSSVAPDANPFVELLYEVDGGFAPVSERLYVWSNGELSLEYRYGTSTAEGSATGEQLLRLRAVVHSPRFRALRASYVPQEICCDGRFHTITVFGPGPTQTVATLDGAEHPPVLDEAIRELQALRAPMPY
jgi:hypothetical protein